MGISYGLGKGLREPCSPGRYAYFFGAPLNSVDADGWNCNPAMTDSASSFDLSTIQEYNEVCVALIAVTDAREGTYRFSFEFYKERTGEMLFSWAWDYHAIEGGWVYSYAYIGWVPWEIDENGQYRVVMRVDGAQYDSQVIIFTISGIPAEPVPPPEPTPAVTTIIELFNNASSFVYAIYLEVLGWTWPLYLAADFFYSLAVVFNNLAWAFYTFNEWVVAVSDRIADILSLDDIVSALETWLNYATWAWEWVQSAPVYIANTISHWWESNSITVWNWIESAIDDVTVLISQLEQMYNSLLSDWNSFTSNILPTLANLTQVDELIASWFNSFSNYWEGWIDWRDRVIEFFSDPVEWLWERFTDWFLGPEV